MSATSLDLSQIKTDALSAAASFRTLIGLGTGNTPTFLALALSGQSLTGSQATSLIDALATWNTTGTPTLIKANVTDTASNANSLLMDLQVGGSSTFSVRKNGRVQISQGDLLFQNGTSSFVLASGLGGGQARARIGYNNASDGELTISSLALSSSISLQRGDSFLVSDSANTLAQRNSTNAQTFRIYNTFTDASNYERGKLEWASNVLRLGTEKAGTGSARALELQTDGTTRLTIGTDGVATFATTVNFQNGSGSTFAQWNGPSRVFYAGGDAFAVLTSDGTTRLYNNGTLCWNASANASSGTIDIRLKRASSGLFQIEADSGVKVRNLANTADADITAAHGTFSNAVTIGAFTLPATDGTSGQVLATNGSGVATWQTRATRAFAVAMAVAL
jgi:hypothetical protein